MENVKKGREREREGKVIRARRRREDLRLKGKILRRGILIETVKAGMAKYKSAQSNLAGPGGEGESVRPPERSPVSAAGRSENTLRNHQLNSIRKLFD
ncbi:hypothetical protein CEXT_568141 [Caerostris extrusa]|uniref:Uncharacterized protein n=1 Tax=Caerostris extrusa TaxID=172846 RepID=A0AAV4VQ66_CAEEX|nr:hypothetical protein CEXT_568141 [Caerostris extrusa]